MNAIALDNQLGMYSELSGAFSSCESLPIHHSTLTFEEMLAIDGLWDWGEFAFVTGTAAVAGAAGGLAVGKYLAAGGPFGWKAAGVAIIAGAIGSAATAAITYTANELRKELSAPEAKTCKCKCACCK